MKGGVCALPVFRRRRVREAPKTSLNRVLGYADLVLLGVGNVVGGGIFILLGVAVKLAGPAVTLCFMFAGLASLCGALCYSEFASRMPTAGSAYAFTYLEAGEIIAWNVGWGIVFELVFGVAGIALGWSAYTLHFLAALGFHPAWLGEMQLNSFITVDCLALLFIIVLSSVVAMGISESKIINHLATGAKLTALLMVVVLGLYKADAHHWDPFMPNGHGSVLMGAGSVMVAFVGFDIVCNAAEECKDPKWGLPIGIIGTVLTSICVYTSVAAALTLMIPWDTVDVEAPLAMAFTGWLPWMVPVISLAGVVGVLAVGLGCIFGSARLLMTLSRDGLLPPFIGAVHETRRTPMVATAIVAFTACVITLLLSFEQLAKMMSAGTLIALSTVCADLLLARKFSQVEGTVGTSLWLLPALIVGYVASLFVAALSVLTSATHEPGMLTAAGATGTLVCGVAILALPEVFRPTESFVAPCGPLVALIGIAMNVMMLSSLEIVIYFLGSWLLVGNVVYATYGFWHSTLAQETAANPPTEASPILASGA